MSSLVWAAIIEALLDEGIVNVRSARYSTVEGKTGFLGLPIPRHDGLLNNGSNDLPSSVFTLMSPDHCSMTQLIGSMPRFSLER